MNLRKKKQLIARTLGVGTDRIILNNERLEEIKEAITRQDINDLMQKKAITIRQARGVKTNVAKIKRRGRGRKKINVNSRKKDYMILTRKLRKHVKGLRSSGKINKEEYKDYRKKIRSKIFRSLSHMQEGAKK